MALNALSSMMTDYVVFAVFIFLSTIYPIWNDRQTKNAASTKQNYVFAKGRVSMFAVMLSIARGMCGVQGFLGYPSEMFYRGTGMWETLYGLLTAYIIVCYLFVPVYCSLELTSIYQYLDMRFNSRLIRCLTSGTFLFRQVFTLGITIYIPCIVIQTVVGLPLIASTISITVLVIIFTLLGGIKAAITADVIQGLLLIVVSLGFIIQGTYDAGGIKQVYQINKNNDRLNFFHFSGDITTRVDTVSAWIGQMFMSISVMGCHQNVAQRLLSMTSVKEVRSNMPFITILFSLSWIVGMVIYSTYHLCDPLAFGYIQKIDQILPFYVEDKLSYIPGILGLFMATLFNGALCLAVSNTNSMATVAWEDYISQITIFQNLADRKQLYAIKSLGITFCVMNLGFVAIVSMMSGVIECFMLTSSITSGPLVGVFILALLIPQANSKGAASGMILSHVISLTLVIGNRMFKLPANDLLPTSIEECNNDTFSPWITKNEFVTLKLEIDGNSEIIDRSTMETIFNISYMYYTVIGAMVTIVIGTIVSSFTKSEKDKFDYKLLHPAVVKLWKLDASQRES